MIKTLAFIKRLPTIDRDTFREHYEKTHVPLALPLLEGLRRYVRYHVEEELFGEVGFDVMTAFGYRDKAATEQVFANLESEAGASILADELSFMDKPANRFFAVSERTWQSGEEGDVPLLVLVTRPSGMSRFDCSSKLVNEDWPRLFERLESPGFALLRDGFPMQGGELPYDSVMQIQCAGTPRFPEWARGLEADGYRVVAVRTRRFETDLGRGSST